MFAYHFTNETLRNGSPIPARNRWLVHTGAITPCESGLHGSQHPFDALRYAPGPYLHYVEIDGELVSHGNPVDKWCGRRRKIIASVDATNLLWTFARSCALSVAHLWDAPDVCLEYLFTGNEELWAASWAASREALWAASWAASRAASWAASRAASWDALWAASWAEHREMFLELVTWAFAEEHATI